MASIDYTSLDELSLPKGGYVLALPGWYPTWLDPLPGDFNQRHIKAAALQTPQVVLYIGKDLTGTLTSTQVKYTQLTANVVEIRVVYPESKIKWWDFIQSNSYFFLLLFKYSNLIKKKWGKPLLLHSYIVMRGGFAGWILSKRWKLPFILTENWTIYYVADPGYLQNRNFLFRWIVKKVFENVNRFLPVTYDLQMQVNKLLRRDVPSVVIPNVVEAGTFFLKPRLTTKNPFHFIHVSTMTWQKNPEGLLRAFKKFHAEHPSTCLWMVGPYPVDVFEYARSLQLSEGSVRFIGTVLYTEVAGLLQSSDVLVLFSRYENLPCVILEALCCGLPVIATTAGGIKEVIEESNGILIDSENEHQLYKAFCKMYIQYKMYDPEKIAKNANGKFSYEAVGEEINSVYRGLIS